MPSRSYAPVALALCLLLAGCVTSPGANPASTVSPTDSTTTTPPVDTSSTSSATTPTDTTAGPSRSWTPSPLDPALTSCSVPEAVSPTPTTEPGTRSGTGDLSAGLEITSAHDGNLTVILRRLPQNVTTFARRYPASEASIDLGPEMADKSGYWTVVVADCEVVWSRPVRDYEALEIHVDADANVSIEQFSEA